MDRNRRIQNSPALQLEQQRLTREVTVLTGVFTTLKQQLETTKIEEVKESDYVVVVDTPEVPLDPSKPDKLLSIIMAGLIGIVLGVLIGFFKEASENDEDKEKILKAKLLFSNNISNLFPERLKKIFRTS